MLSRFTLVAIHAVIGGALAAAALPAVKSPARARATSARAAAAPECAGLAPGLTRVAMRHVAFHAASHVILDIRELDGVMQATAGVVDFDDSTSYALDVTRGEIALDGAALSHLMNEHVFGYAGAPIKHVKITIANGVLRQSGTLHKGVDIPFDMIAQPTLLADGRIRLHPVRMKIFDVNGKTLMRALNLSLAKMLDLSKAHGVSVAGDDLILDPMAVLPAPAMRARVTAIRLDGNAMVQTLGAVPTAPVPNEVASIAAIVPDSAARNFMYYRCGTIRFGKMTMRDAEMLVVDGDQRDAFDFDVMHYQRQLVAGYSRTLPSLGLEVTMPDAGKLGNAVVAQH